METILITINNGIAWLTLNRPEKMNAFNREMALALQNALLRCEEESIRVVVITGNGNAFSAGQDLSEITAPNAPSMNVILSQHYNPLVTQIRALQKPVIAAVNGVAAGAGANLALCCDLVLASSQAAFIQAFSKIGLIPDTGGTYFLPRLIGLQKAMGLMMTGEKITAEEAERIGLIYKYFPQDDFTMQVENMALYLSKMPTKALALTKEALQRSLQQELSEQLTTEDQLQQAAAQTEDFKEGVAAFTAKRVPLFTGK